MKVILRNFVLLLCGLCTAWTIGCGGNSPEKLGGKGNQDGQAVVQSPDGGFVVAGLYEQSDLSTDLYILKVDAAGKIVWTKMYGEAGCYDYPRSIALTSDGGFIIAGETESYGPAGNDGSICNFWIVKLDASGDLIWNKAYGDPQRSGAMQAVETSDGGYAVCGYTHDFSGMGMKVYLLDSDGGIIWEKTFSDQNALVGYSIKQTTDGGFIMAGTSDPSTGTDGDPDYVIIKMDPSGNVEFSKRYGDARHEFARSVIQTSDGGYVVAGHKQESFFQDGNTDAWIMKLDALGEIEWSDIIGAATGFDAAYSVLETSGGYVFAGETQSYGKGKLNSSDAWVVKLDPDGNVLWNKTYGDASYDVAYTIAAKNDGGFVFTGVTVNGIYKDDIYLVRLDSSGNRQIP
jgi:hypothetical protein